MKNAKRSSLADLADWVQATDPHASYRLPLLKAGVQILHGEKTASLEERRTLADKLERWRYQVFNHHSGRVTPKERELVDALDLASNRLVLSPDREPRNPRMTLRSLDDEQIVASLGPDIPLEEIVRQATLLTQQHFGTQSRQMFLYTPLYLSNHCVNHCTYCAFRYPHKMERECLTRDEAMQQAEILRQRGFRHILLVAGDFPGKMTTRYFSEIVGDLKDRSFDVSIEIASQSTVSYAALVRAGARGVCLYQETYDEDLYARFHPRGPKAWFDFRLEALERAAEAGMERLGLGILLGLAEPRQDVLTMIRHGRYLQKRFPHVALAFSLPRIEEAPDGFEPSYRIDTDRFIRLYCVLRLAFPQAHLVLSTRERDSLRQRLARICITQMSAGSSTAPGGYESNVDDRTSRQQFPVFDDRSPAEVARSLRNEGFDVCWEMATEKS